MPRIYAGAVNYVSNPNEVIQPYGPRDAHGKDLWHPKCHQDPTSKLVTVTLDSGSQLPPVVILTANNPKSLPFLSEPLSDAFVVGVTDTADRPVFDFIAILPD